MDWRVILLRRVELGSLEYHGGLNDIYTLNETTNKYPFFLNIIQSYIQILI
jgi:hypothetical protein